MRCSWGGTSYTVAGSVWSVGNLAAGTELMQPHTAELLMAFVHCIVSSNSTRQERGHEGIDADLGVHGAHAAGAAVCCTAVANEAAFTWQRPGPGS